MLLLIICVIFPLSLCRGIHALEIASSCGMFVLAALCAVLTADAVHNGFAGVTSGDVPLWTLNWRSAHIGEAAPFFQISLDVGEDKFNIAKPGPLIGRQAGFQVGMNLYMGERAKAGELDLTGSGNEELEAAVQKGGLTGQGQTAPQGPPAGPQGPPPEQLPGLMG